jgi:hypothetical protein
MIYFAMAFVTAFMSLFLAMTILAFSKRTAYGLGWSVSQANQPVLFWLCVGGYIVGLVGSLFFLLIVLAIVFDPSLR